MLQYFLNCRFVVFFCTFHLNKYYRIFQTTGQLYADGPLINIYSNELSKSFSIVLGIRLFTLFTALVVLSSQACITGVIKAIVFNSQI